MRVHLRLGEPFWRAAGQRDVTVALPRGATVAQALAVLTRRYPPLAAELDNGEVPPALFMNEAEACPDSPLVEGAILHVVWPMSGG